MKKSLFVLLLTACLLSVASCKPNDECSCTRVINKEIVREIRPLGGHESCQELAEDFAVMLGKEVNCF